MALLTISSLSPSVVPSGVQVLVDTDDGLEGQLNCLRSVTRPVSGSHYV
jgi:hypothetical protein